MANPNAWTLVGDTSSSWNGSREIDLREQIHLFLFGDPTHVAHGSYYIIRRMRRDSKGQPVRCTCSQNLYFDTPKNAGRRCRHCNGEGFLSDDTIVTGYLSRDYPHTGLEDLDKFGQWGPVTPMLYLEYDALASPGLGEQDKIIEPVKDLEGKLLSPIELNASFTIMIVNQLRSDRGRVEYIRLRLGEEHKYAS